MLNIYPPPLTIETTGANNIQVLYLTKEEKEVKELDQFTEEIKDIIHENGIRNAIVTIYGEIMLDDIHQ